MQPDNILLEDKLDIFLLDMPGVSDVEDVLTGRSSPYAPFMCEADAACPPGSLCDAEAGVKVSQRLSGVGES